MVSSMNIGNNASVSVLMDRPVIQATSNPTNFVISADKANVANYAREGSDLVIELNDGRTVRIKDFFLNGADFNNVIFSSGGGYWLVDMSNALGKSPDGIDEGNVTYVPLDSDDNNSLLGILAGLAGAGALVGLIAANTDTYTPVTIPTDTTPPPMPVFTAWDNVEPATGQIEAGTSTNDSTPTLKGSGAEPGSKIIITIDNLPSVTVIADANGNWSYTPGTPLGEGDHVVKVVAEDAAGNQSGPAYIEFNVDTVPPDTPDILVSDDGGNEIADGQYTNDNTPTVTGQGEPGNTIIIEVGGKEVGEVTVGEDGTWEFTIPELPDGDYTVVVTEQDPAGNESSTETIVRVDTEAPSQTVEIVSYKDDVSPQVGDFQSGSATNDTAPLLSGTISDTLASNEVVAIYRDGVKIGEAEVNGTSWTYQDGSLSDGETYSYTARVEDAAGNQGAESDDFMLAVDTTAPTQSTAIESVVDDCEPVTGEIANKGLTNDTSPTVNGTISGPLNDGEVVAVYRDGVKIGEADVDGATWSYDDSGLVDGATYQYTARVEDAAGNRGGISGSHTITVDAAAPEQTATIETIYDDVIEVVGDVGNGGTTNDSQPEIRGSISAALDSGEIVAIYRDGEKIGEATVNGTSWTFTDTTGLTNNTTYEYTARVEDAAGNQGAESDVYEMTLKTEGPDTKVTIEHVADDMEPVTGDIANTGWTNDTTPQLSGILSVGLETGEKVVIYRDGIEIGEADVDGTAWSYDDSGLVDGETYTYTARVEDAAGNPGADSNAWTINVDATDPEQTVEILRAVDNVDPVAGDIENGGTTNDDTPTLHGTISSALASNEVVAIYRSSDAGATFEKVGEATVSGMAWTYEDSGLASGSSYTYMAKVVDTAGNESTESNSLAFNINTSDVEQSVDILQIIDNMTPGTGMVQPGGSTNDASPTLEGSISMPLSNGDVIEILRDGVVIGTATVVDETSWTFTDADLSDGTYEYTARVVNSGGNQGALSDGYAIEVDLTEPSQTVTIESYTDNQTPMTGTFLSDTTTNDTSPQLSGTISDQLDTGEIVVIYRSADGGGTFEEIGSAIVDGQSWTFQDSGLSDGKTYSYKARVEDAAGNQGTESPDFALTIDTSAPVAAPTIDSVYDSFAPVTGFLTFGDATNDAKPTVVGSGAEPNSTVYIYDNDVKIAEVLADGSGNWTFEPTENLQDGPHSLKASSVDIAGNESPKSEAFDFELDTVSPTQSTSITSVTDDQEPVQGSVEHTGTTNDTSPTINGTILEALNEGEKVIIYRDDVKIGEATMTDDTHWTYGDQDLSDGTSYRYTARVEDAAGNRGAISNPYEITIDATAPEQNVTIRTIYDNVVPSEGELQSGDATNDSRPELQGSVTSALAPNEDIVIYRSTDGGSTYVEVGKADVNGTSWTFTDASGMVDETTYTYMARVEDAAGNTSDNSNTFEITLQMEGPNTTTEIISVSDDEPPVTDDIPNNGWTNDTSPTLHGTISTELDTGEEVVIYRSSDGGSNYERIGTAETDGQNWTYGDTDLTDGLTYVYMARVEDAAGNPGTDSNAWTIKVDATDPSQEVVITRAVDNFEPEVGDISPNGTTNDDTPTLHGTISQELAANEVVAIFRSKDGGALEKIGEAVIDGTGTGWTFTDSSLANLSTYTYEARVVDSAGNESDASNSLTFTVNTSIVGQVANVTSVLDDETPVTGQISNNGWTNDTSPTVKGSLSLDLNPGDEIRVLRNGEFVGVATVDGTGLSWTYEDSGLVDGQTYVYTAIVVNSGANEGSAGASYTIHVDLTPPPQSVDISSYTDNQNPVMGTFLSGTTTNDLTPLLSGTISATLGTGEVVTVYRKADGGSFEKIGTATVDGMGLGWTFQDSGLTDGETYAYVARVEDAAGNQGAESAQFTLTIDQTVPPQTVTIDNYIDSETPETGTFLSGTTTNDASPELHGTISAAPGDGEIVVIYRSSDGVTFEKIGEAAVDGTGLGWTYEDSGLTDGETYTYQAYVEDAAGNLSAGSPTFVLTVDRTAPPQTVTIDSYIDSEAPQTGTFPSGTTTNDVTPELQGTISQAPGDGEAVVIYRDGEKIGTATMIGDTNWTFEDTTGGFSNGETYTYNAYVEDAAGNLGAGSPDFTIKIETSNPTQALTIDSYIDDEVPQTGTFLSGTTTNDVTPELQGTISQTLGNGEVVVIYRDDGKIGTATMIDDTNWTFEDATGGLSDGETYTYKAYVENAAGSLSPGSTGFVITIDQTEPPQTVTIDNYIDDEVPQAGTFLSGTTTNDAAPVLSGTVSAALGSNEVVAIYRSVDGGTTFERLGPATIDGTGLGWTFQESGLSDGNTYTYVARVEDTAGNQGGASDNFLISVDLVEPSQIVEISDIQDDEVPVTGTVAPGGWTNDTTPSLSGTISFPLADGEVVAIYRDNVKIGEATVTDTSWEFEDTTGGLADGNSYAYTARVEDAAGNTSEMSDDYEINIDITDPVVTPTIVSYTDNVGAEQGDFGTGIVTDDRQPVLNGSLDGSLATGEAVHIYEGTTFIGAAVVDNSAGTWSFGLPNLEDGSTHTYTAVVVDAAGNQGAVSNNFVVNVDLTILVTEQNTLDTTPIVTGSTGFEIMAGEYLEVTINGVIYSSKTGEVVVDPDNNTWYVQIPDANALDRDTTYDVGVALKRADGTVITTDDTTGELFIGPEPQVDFEGDTNDPMNKGTALTLGEDGQWRIFANMTVMDANGTDITSISSFSSNYLTGNEGVMGVATFIDFDRDGYMDIFGEDSAYWDGQQAFRYTPGITYTSIPGAASTVNGKTNVDYQAFQVGSTTYSSYGDRVDYSGSGTTSANAYIWYGAIVGYDKDGDGYVDIVMGDNTPNDSESAQGFDTSYLYNNEGIWQKDSDLVYDPVPAPASQFGDYSQSSPGKMASSVDLNNDGFVDVAYNSDDGANHITGGSGSTSNAYKLIVAYNNGGTMQIGQIMENVFINNTDMRYNGQSMNWADFNGDGYLDLFLSTTYGASTAIQNQSKIYFNDGSGRIDSGGTNASGIDTSAGSVYNMGDDLRGGGSVAVDWDCDGRIDVIEVPEFPNNSADPIAAQRVLLFTNNTANNTVSFAQSTLTTMPDSGAGSAISGLLAFDLDWDGDKDLILFTGTDGATFVQNTSEIDYGTSLHLKILDEEGINALYGNTVQLFDSTGNLVATQIVNPHSGNQTNDSTALVDFYGLDAAETYSVVLLRNVDGAASHVGGQDGLGGYTINNVNEAWTGLKATNAYDAHVLTAEGGGDTNNANIGNGIVGTGYNDTFYATLGIDAFNGGGGTTIVSDDRVWSNTGGIDIVDYKLADELGLDTGVTVDLSRTDDQNSGFGTQAFVNIEGIAGTSHADTLTDSAADNVFNGRGGNDTFNLTNGGKDTLLYDLINTSEPHGGNGHDIVNGFTVGTYEATDNADRIDISQLLIGYTADADGPAHYINGIATIDEGDRITEYLSVSHSGGNTILNIDRDGAGGSFTSAEILTLNDTTVSLETLLANHQIVV